VTAAWWVLSIVWGMPLALLASLLAMTLISRRVKGLVQAHLTGEWSRPGELTATAPASPPATLQDIGP
jgi:hypothetical protein